MLQLFLFKMLPVLHTFIHFRIVASHVRCLSAPPVLTSGKIDAPSAALSKKRKRKRRPKVDADAVAIDEYAKERVREQWRLLAHKFCAHTQQTARLDSDFRHHQLTLPRELFLDIAFYTFQKDSARTLLKLYQAGTLTEPVNDEVWICCSRRQLRQKTGNPIRKVIEEGKKVLEASRKGHFGIVFNNAVIVFLKWNADLTVSTVIQKIVQILCPQGCGETIAMHRHTILKDGKFGDLGLTAGCTIAVIPV